MKKWKKIIYVLAAGFFMAVAIVAVCDITVSQTAKTRIYDATDSIPYREVGLVLGTSPISTWNGRHNYYFDHRIAAAAQLYAAGKVDRLIVSGGDYRAEGGYDEPAAMRDSLINRGIPSEAIEMDYQGLRTINSIVNIKDVYGLDSITIISQKYHNERALYQAQHVGIEAIAYNAVTPPRMRSKVRNRLRESLARVWLFIDFLIS